MKGMETGSGRTHGKSGCGQVGDTLRHVRHRAHGTEPLDVRKEVLIGKCSDRASKGANTVTIESLYFG